MKIQQINQIFKKIGESQVRYRWPVLIIALLLTVFGFSGLRYTQSVSNQEHWFEETEDVQIAQDRFEEQFGNNEFVGLLIQADDVFHPEVLTMIRDIGEELMEKVPYADDVSSLMKFETTVGTEEGIEVINPFDDGIPTDPEELKIKRDFILSRNSVVNKMVSDDGTETWLTLSLSEYPEETVWKKTSSMQPIFQDGEAAIAVVTDPKWKSDRYTIKAVGAPYTETEERDFFGRETMTRIGSGLGLMVLLLVVFLRTPRGVVVPVFTTGAGIAVVFGFMGWLGIDIDMNMIFLPVMLGMALSVGYSVHLVNAFKRIFREGGRRKQAVIQSVEETGWPIFFTAATTIASVLSFAVSGIMPIRWVGFTSAAVVLAVYLFVMILIPIFMSFGKDKEIPKGTLVKKLWLNQRLEEVGAVILNRKGIIAAAFIILVIGFAPGISRIVVNADIFEAFGLKIPYIKRVHEVVNSKLGSYMTYNITVTYDNPNAVKDPDVLKRFDALLSEVGTFELTTKNRDVPKIFSILDILKEMNQTFHEDNPAWYTVPNSRELVAQLLFLYELSGGKKTFDWVDEEYTLLRARVELRGYDSNEIEKEFNRIRTLDKELFPDAKVNIVGGAVRMAEINKKIVTGELKSFAAALIAIGLLMALVFGSIKTGLIGMIPNVTPLIILAGFMGYFNYTLDMMTMTIIPLLLGIAVDDSIHFINQIKFEFEKCGNYRQAILNSFYVVGKTLTMTTIILVASFAMYMFSPVIAMFRIGLLASMGLVSALVADFTMTPIVILLTKPFGREIRLK
jgi:predicted RND superfamily exporter protein